MFDFYRFLAQHGIADARHDHPPLYTVKEAERLVPPLPGAKSTNLERLTAATGHRIQIIDIPDLAS